MIEMTPTERAYYDLLSPVPTDADGSNYQLLSVSMLDASLAILNLAKDFNAKNDPPSVERCKEWRESLNQIREQARVRWILDEKCLASRLSAYNSKTSTRLSSTTMAERRSFFEQRVMRPFAPHPSHSFILLFPVRSVDCGRSRWFPSDRFVYLSRD